MSIRNIAVIGCLAFFCTLPLQAQRDDPRQLINEAEAAFQIGKVEEARQMLEGRVATLSSSLRLRGYRLLSLCYLALENTDEARKYAVKVLDENPYYTPTVEYSPRFIDMIEEIKQGRNNTITTASSQAETLEEVPVPTVLITEEMIRYSGAQNLQEVLAAFVPGINIIDCNDDINIGMRGIYGQGQQKILIMLNGHRLNSYCTNIAAPDFSISLEKVKQIEVLRGPASSLYGGVALTGVVNIITKQGADVDGLEAHAGIGNHSQLRGDLVFGKRYYDLDMLIWGSLYGNQGQHMDTPDILDHDIYGKGYDTVIIGRIGNKPTYDFGIQMKYKDLHLLFDTRHSEIVSPYTMSTLAKAYNHDRYRRIDGYSPSFVTRANHIELGYTPHLKNVTLRGAVTYDNSVLAHYQVISDSEFSDLGYLFIDTGSSEVVNNLFTKPGIFRYISGTEQNIGIQLKGDYGYSLNDEHNGNLSFGMEYSHFQLDDIRYTLGYNFNQLIQEGPIIAEAGRGHEDAYDAFLQLKHKWRSFIFNAGLRYDHKRHEDGIKLGEYSPRLALIMLRPKWNIKLSYSRSFVDAPYLYRKSNELLPLLFNDSSEDLAKLEPEIVYSFQLTLGATQWINGLNFELNGFLNKGNNLIQTNVLTHSNAGTNKTAGLEFLGNYRHPKFSADMTLTWTRTFKMNVLDIDIDANNNTPAVMSNLVLNWKPIPNLNIHSHILFESKQKSYNTDLVQVIAMVKYGELAEEAKAAGDYDSYIAYSELSLDAYTRIVTDLEMPARAIVNVGADYQWKKFTLGFNVRNLFNTTYYRSGMNTKLVPQKGLWFLFDVAYKF